MTATKTPHLDALYSKFVAALINETRRLYPWLEHKSSDWWLDLRASLLRDCGLLGTANTGELHREAMVERFGKWARK